MYINLCRYVCSRNVYMYMHTYYIYTCIHACVYMGTYAEMHGIILHVCMYRNKHILDIHMYVYMYIGSINEHVCVYAA